MANIDCLFLDAMLGMKKAPSTILRPTDWTICALCQQQTEEPLKDVSKARNQSSQAAYETLAVHQLNNRLKVKCMKCKTFLCKNHQNNVATCPSYPNCVETSGSE